MLSAPPAMCLFAGWQAYHQFASVCICSCALCGLTEIYVRNCVLECSASDAMSGRLGTADDRTPVEATANDRINDRIDTTPKRVGKCCRTHVLVAQSRADGKKQHK